MVEIYIINNYKQNKILYLLPLFGLLSFTTWYLNIDELHNIILYSSILIIMAFFKAKDTTLIMFTLFTVAANRTPSFLEGVDKLYLKLFETNISALRRYYTFLYTFVFVVLIIILLIRLIKRRKYSKGKLLIPMVLLIAYSLITLLWAPNLSTGLSEFWFIIQGYFIYYVLRNKDSKENIFYELSWFLTILLLVISAQYFVSYKEYIISKDLDINFFNFYKIEGKRAIKLWANPNIVGGVFSIAYIPSLYKYFDTKRTNKRFLFIPFELLIIYAIVLTKSKGLHYAFLVGLLFLPFLFIKNKKLLYTFIISAILMFIVFLVTIIHLEDAFPDIYNKLNEYTTSRIDIYKDAIELLRSPKTFIFGKGLGADRLILNVSFFHSWVFQVLVNRGIIGLSLIFIMLYYIVETLFQSKNNFRYLLAIGIIIYLAHGITDSGFEYQYIGVIFFLLVALLENSIEKDELFLID